MAIYQGDKIIAGAGAGSYRNIGEIVPSLIPLSDAGLHLLDGAQISGSGVYAEFFNYISTLVSTYPNLFCTEAQWQTSVSAYGVCGKFVYDSVNNTARLPKITGIIEGTTDTTALGDLVEAGLPNITGHFMGSRIADTAGDGNTGASYNAGGNTGALKGSLVITSAPNTNLGTGSRSNGYILSGLDFNASKSNEKYGNSNTVQPQTIKAYYYIVVANSTKLSTQANLDGIVSDLNLKAGTDLANLSSAGEIYGSKLSMPSDTWEDVTVATSGTAYTMPGDGWLTIAISGNPCFAELVSYTDVSTTGLRTSSSCYNTSLGWARATLPVKKGQLVNIYYGGTSITIRALRFTYATGATSEQ